MIDNPTGPIHENSLTLLARNFFIEKRTIYG
uniref:Uncharacterized protein n=1 Tax=Siphoviridae sp. ctpoI7 TaxID=2825678 RepID=A0A8S5PAY5_9CAUD|nr:MAG TPA: hypothetical protein [Siphoviridae sp. ctpoI7]